MLSLLAFCFKWHRSLFSISIFNFDRMGFSVSSHPPTVGTNLSLCVVFGLGFLFFFMKKHKLCHIHRVLEQRQEGAFHILGTDSKNPSLCQVCQLWLPASVRFCPLSMRALKLGHMLGLILVKSTRLAQAITIKWRENVRQTLKARVSVNAVILTPSISLRLCLREALFIQTTVEGN